MTAFKRVVAVFLSVQLIGVYSSVMSAEEVWDGTVASAFGGGIGTVADPYQIANGAQLAFLAQRVNAWDADYNSKCYILTSDILLNNTADWKNWSSSPPARAWISIGNNNNSFRGVFDGNGHKIHGIYIYTASNYQGLFGYITGTVKNTGVVNSYIRGSSYIGGVAGYVSGYSASVINSYNTGNVRGTGGCVGGVAGYVSGTSAGVSNSYNTGNVRGTGGNVGGVVGTVQTGTISNSSNTGDVIGADGVGGVAGSVSYCTVSNSCNIGNVGGNHEAGGVAGSVSDSSVTNSYNTGNVSGTDWGVGGVTGAVSHGTISNSYNTGSVSSDCYYVGGVAGTVQNGGTISNSYNIGNVSGESPIDGVADVYSGTVSNSYYLDTCVAGGYSYGRSRTDAELRFQSTFSDWDFVSTWIIDAAIGYPYPQLRSNPHTKAIVSYSDNLVTITAPGSIESARLVLCAYYDRRLVSFEIQEISLSKGVNIFSPQQWNTNGASFLKVMLWKDTDSMMPLCNVYEAAVANR